MSPDRIQVSIADGCTICPERKESMGLKWGMVYCGRLHIWTKTNPFCCDCVRVKYPEMKEGIAS